MAHFHPVPERIDLLLVQNVLVNVALLRVHDALPHLLIVSCARYATDHIVLAKLGQWEYEGKGSLAASCTRSVAHTPYSLSGLTHRHFWQFFGAGLP